uniref:Uncharacterized protein n=1 Tax=Arundo donax TaxID=35708 RepID=A0A0A9A1H3_ARUDO
MPEFQAILLSHEEGRKKKLNTSTRW